MKNIVAYISGQLPTNTSFAVSDDGENIFIPASVATLMGKINIGEKFLFKCVPQDHTSTPWRALTASEIDEEFIAEPEPEPEPDVDVDVLALVLNGGFHTASSVSIATGIGKDDTEERMDALHADGKIYCALVYAKASDETPVKTLFMKEGEL